MLFNSVSFLIFLPIILLLYQIIPSKGREIFLLGASYYFYMCWNPKFIVLILFSTLVTYLGALLLEHTKGQKRKFVLGIAISLNLAVLFFFKYLNFALHFFQKVMNIFHVHMQERTFDILLPVGISFFTFQALGYLIDVYREQIKAEKSFVRYALFVSFFPQLVAGPIERSHNLLSQLSDMKKISHKNIEKGIFMMLWGFFLKLVLADRIGIFVGCVYGDYENYPGLFIVIATILFAIQVYCDFYGYSVIAKGTAKMIGIELMENFESPYLACSVADFWRGWHISLTTWFKDYLYIPLGGNRKGKLRKYANKMIVFTISGLWHGASFSYVAWGAINGLYQVVGEMLMPIRNKFVQKMGLNRESIGHKIVSMLFTFVCVDFAWIFFRAGGMSNAIGIIRNMVGVLNPWILWDGSIYECGINRPNFVLLIICLCLLLFADICKKNKIIVHEMILKQDAWCRSLIIAFSVVFILIFGIYGVLYEASNFIYFQF